MTDDANILDVASGQEGIDAGELDDTLFRGLSNRERMRLTETLSAVPQDARSVLEIGFNDFRMTRALLRFHDVVTTDLPREVVPRPAAFKLVFCNVRALPFTDQAFDIIVCTEVLEHLDEATLRLGIAELARVSSRYVLVTVPYRQQVWNELFKCSRCGHEENSMGHLRCITEDDLRSWFPAWKPLILRTIGRIDGQAPSWVYACARRIGDVWFDYWTDRCPKCGERDSRVPDNVLGFFLRRIIWRLRGLAAPQPAWLLAVFDRT